MNVVLGAMSQVEARIISRFTCQDDVMNLHCSSKAIKIYYATYSRRQASVCSKDGINSAEYCDPVVKTSLARKLCEGQMTCNITVDRSTMGDKCPTVFKYLNVMYDCSKSLSLNYLNDVFIAVQICN